MINLNEITPQRIAELKKERDHYETRRKKYEKHNKRIFTILFDNQIEEFVIDEIRRKIMVLNWKIEYCTDYLKHHKT